MSRGDELFLLLGVPQYGDPRWRELPHVRNDVDRMSLLLEHQGLARRQAKYLTPESSVEDVLRALKEWASEPAKKTVIYWAGHAEVGDTQVYLLVKDSPYDNRQWESGGALPIAGLAEWLARAKSTQILLLLDTCAAGGAATDILSAVWSTLDSWPTQKRAPTLQVLGAVRAYDPSFDGWGLARALDEVLRRGRASTKHLWTEEDEFVSVEQIFEELHDGQRLPRPVLKGSPLGSQFFRNLGFHPASLIQTVEESRGHFWPRSRGVVGMEESGWYFAGRSDVLKDLTEWLRAGRGLRVLTGLPGAGKSAVLGRLATLADAEFRQFAETEGVVAEAGPGTVPPVGAVSLALSLKAKNVEDLLRSIAAAHGIPLSPTRTPSVAGVRAQLDEQVRLASRMPALVLDGLDEAKDPEVVADAIRQLSQTQRVLVGTRRNLGRGSGEHPADLGPLLKALGATPSDVVELGDDANVELAIKQYARHRLMDSRRDCAYQWDSAVAAEAASSIARAANGIFRLAHDWCRLLCTAPDKLYPTSEKFLQLLRQGSDGVFQEELARFEDDEQRAREMLSALAVSEGLGLPRAIWPEIATALSSLVHGAGSRYELSDAVWCLNQTGRLVLEAGESGRTVYRLYHQAFADYLRARLADVTDDQVHRAIASTLIALGTASGWEDIDSYLAVHLSSHAAAGGLLDVIVTDPRYLAAADPARLLGTLGALESATARDFARLYIKTAHRLRGHTPVERAAALEMAGHQQGWGDRLATRWHGIDWHTAWARWNPSREVLTIDAHNAAVNGIAIGDIDGTPVLATVGADGWARISDARSGEQLRALGGDDGALRAVSLREFGGRVFLAAGSSRGRIRVWDARSGELLATIDGIEVTPRGLALGSIDGHTIVAARGADDTVRIWHAVTGDSLLDVQLKPVHRPDSRGLALGERDGQPAFASLIDDTSLGVWDARTGQLLSSAKLDGPDGLGSAPIVHDVCVGQFDERAVLLVATEAAEYTIACAWDFTTGKPAVAIACKADDSAECAALGTLSGQPVVVTAGRGGRMLRAWHGRTGELLQVMDAHGDEVNQVVLGQIGERAVAATASTDRTARLWDLGPLEPRPDPPPDPASSRPAWAVGEMHRVTLGGDRDWVTSVSLGHLDRRPVLASGSANRTARLIDATGGQELAVFRGHRGAVRAVAFGEVAGQPLLLTASDDGLAGVWHMRTGDQLRRLRGHAGPVLAIAPFTVGGRANVVTGGEDTTVRIWSARTGRQLKLLEGHRGEVRGIAVATVAGRVMIASASIDETVRVWDAQTGRERLRLEGEQWLEAVAFGSIDGRAVVVAGGHDQTARVWDIRTGQQVLVLRGHDHVVDSVAFEMLDGEPVIATGSYDCTARVWDARTGEQRFELSGFDHDVASVAFGSVGGRPVVATGGGDCIAHVWDARTGDELVRDYGHVGESGFHALLMGNSEGRPVAVTTDMDSEPELWRSSLGEDLLETANHTGRVTAVAHGNVDSRPVVVSASENHIVRVWDPAMGEPLLEVNSPYCGGYGVALGELAGRPVIATARAEYVWLWDARTGAPLRGLTAEPNDWVVQAIALDTVDGEATVAVACNDGNVRLWNPWTGRLQEFQVHTDTVRAVTPGRLQGAPVIVSASCDETARIFDGRSGRLLTTLEGHRGWVNAVVVGQVSRRALVVTGGQDRTVRIWDAGTGSQLLTLDGHTGPVVAVAVGVLDGREVVASASEDETLRIWDPRTGGLEMTFCLWARPASLTLGHGRLVIGCDLGLLAFEHRG